MMRFTLMTLRALLLVLPCSAVLAVETVADFGANPGNLKMYQHVPANAPSAMPVVLVLHGCLQGATAYAQDTGWVDLADQMGFALVLAEQQALNNANLCFNWYQDSDITRGQGEAESIHQMLVKFSSTHAVDATRVFVTGVSSGGAMAGVLLAAYPELFSAGALFAGVPYHCSTTLAASFGCMTGATTHSATQWGDLVRAASTHTAPWPRVSIWHGTADHTVAPVNADQEVLQWTNVHGLASTPSSTETQGIDSIKRFAGVDNVVRVEQHLLAGMDHGTPVDPGTGAQQCGTATAYVLDVNICSARVVATFFGLTAPAPSLDASVPMDAAVSTPDAAVQSRDAGTSSSASSGNSDVGTIPACTCQDGGGRDGAPVVGLALALLLGRTRQRRRAPRVRG